MLTLEKEKRKNINIIGMVTLQINLGHNLGFEKKELKF